MTVEAFVFLGIVLLVWFIASVGSWLREQIERYTRYQEESSVQESSLPSPVFESVQPEEATTELPNVVPASVVVRESLKRPSQLQLQLRYRSRTAARRGIILMTVFGACKALDVRDKF